MKIGGINFSDLNSSSFCDYLYEMDPKPNYWVVFVNKEKNEVNIDHLFKNYKQVIEKIPDETKLFICLSGNIIPPKDALSRLAKVMKKENADIVYMEKDEKQKEIKSNLESLKLDCFLIKRDILDNIYESITKNKNLKNEIKVIKLTLSNLKSS